jgi:hypothetical protein
MIQNDDIPSYIQALEKDGIIVEVDHNGHEFTVTTIACSKHSKSGSYTGRGPTMRDAMENLLKVEF